MSVTVLIADDEPLLAEALRDLLSVEERFEVVAVVGDANDAVLVAERQRPSLALIDVRMPGGGPAAARGIAKRSPGTRVVAFSAYEDRWAVLEMVQAGAVGYLVKGAPPEELLRALHEVADGRPQLTPSATGEILGELAARLRTGDAQALALRDRRARIHELLDDPAGLTVHLQPVHDLAAGEVAGVETLARFPTRGSAPQGPARWFADAWGVGLGADLELVALHHALGCLPRLPEPLWLSVNISPETLFDERFAVMLPDGALHRIVLEVTEHAPIADYEQVAAVLGPLRAKGLQLAVDDAGAGFASLRHILQLAPDHVKLDASLIRGIDESGPQRALALGLLGFADALGASVVAEGIETAAEHDTVRGLGARYGQGYHLARPADWRAVCDALEAR